MADKTSEKKGKFFRFLALGLIIASIVVVYLFTPIRDYLSVERIQDLRQVILGTGVWAPVVFVLIYILATILVLPGSALTILAGIIFGVWGGTLITIIAANLGANAAFLISRYLGKGVAERFAKGNLEKISQKIENHGFWFMFGLRMLPIAPFNLLNYAAGLAPIKWKDYALASLIGMIPGTFAYVSLGNTVNHISLTDPKAWLQIEVWGPFLLIVALVVGGKFVQKLPWVQKRMEMKNAEV